VIRKYIKKFEELPRGSIEERNFSWLHLPEQPQKTLISNRYAMSDGQNDTEYNIITIFKQMTNTFLAYLKTGSKYKV
jgi:hypothetical protein